MSERLRLEIMMKHCMEEHAEFLRPLLNRYSRQMITETLIGAAAILSLKEVEAERPDIPQDEIDRATHALLTKFQNAIDTVHGKYLNHGTRN